MIKKEITRYFVPFWAVIEK